MKKLFFILATGFVLFSMNPLQAQIRKIPAEVTESFKEKYADSKNVEWKDKVTFFQANFEMKGDKYEARFNSKGQWQEREKAIEKDHLPSDVKDGFDKSKFSDWEVRSVAWVENKDAAIQYRVLVKKNSVEKKYLFFNEQGKLLRESITI